jgi:hypothetical protein
MKLKSVSKLVSFAAGVVMLPLGLSATPAPLTAAPSDLSVAPFQSAPLQRVGWEEAKRRKLRQAYWLLEQGSHDYKGHRAEAMEHIRKAGEIIGMDLHGDGYAGDKQVDSDERLRMARRDLKDVVEETGGREHEHIRIAIKEIDRALEVR